MDPSIYDSIDPALIDALAAAEANLSAAETVEADVAAAPDGATEAEREAAVARRARAELARIQAERARAKAQQALDAAYAAAWQAAYDQAMIDLKMTITDVDVQIVAWLRESVQKRRQCAADLEAALSRRSAIVDQRPPSVTEQDLSAAFYTTQDAIQRMLAARRTAVGSPRKCRRVAPRSSTPSRAWSGNRNGCWTRIWMRS